LAGYAAVWAPAPHIHIVPAAAMSVTHSLIVLPLKERHYEDGAGALSIRPAYRNR
jgi:hypothetical protein